MYRIIHSFNSDTLLAERDGRRYVLKHIRPEGIELVRRLRTLNNRYVVRIFDTTLLNNQLYAVEEYIEGITLSEYLRRNGPLSEEVAVHFACCVLSGLADIHALGIIHRDINPNNIIIDTQRNARIIDFGISRTGKEQQGSDTNILGTQGYAAPEQYGFKQTDSRADIYAVGVLINYMATLQMPAQRLAGGRLGAIILKCTEMDVENRYGTAVELIDVLLGRNAQPKHSSVPGFRQNIFWHKAVAVTYYIFVAIALAAYLSDWSDVYQTVYFLLFIVFLMIVPVAIFFNLGNWLPRLLKKKRMTPAHQKSVCVSVGVIYEFITFIIFIIFFKQP